jgi:hypothetical protein
MGGQGFTEPIRSGFGKVQASINAGNNANRVLGFKGLGFVIYVRSFFLGQFSNTQRNTPMPFGIGLEVFKTEISNQMWWGLCLGWCVWHFAVFKYM